MIKIHLSKLLWERRMTQKQLPELTGIRRNAINDWYNEIGVSIKFEHIDRICEVPGCSVSDLIEYIPNQVPRTGKYLVTEEHGNQKDKKKQ